jgi:2-dehydro-3-deoxygluconokinase
MMEQWRAERIMTDLVETRRGRQPGLYWIDTDTAGERSFAYWRGEAPVRDLFDSEAVVDRLIDALEDVGLLYFSGITLSLFHSSARERLFAVLSSLRDRGVVIGFDGNFRPSGWQSAAEARTSLERACRVSQIVLPTHDDEAALFGDADAEATAARIRGWGADEVVVKQGGDGCLVACDHDRGSVSAERVLRPLDTTAAGDAFNAGYLAARYRGSLPLEAAAQANRLASVVIGHRGAIIPAAAMPVF